MASFRGVQGVMAALESYLQRSLPPEWRQGTINARVRLLGSADLAQSISGNLLGIYLHRIALDPYGRNRSLPPADPRTPSRHAELPVNLHCLVLANGASPGIEADLMSWAMLALAERPYLEAPELIEADPDWGDREQVSIAPEDMAPQDLMRIWDLFQASYTLSACYVLRSVRLRLSAETSLGGPVVSRIFPAGTLGGGGS